MKEEENAGSSLVTTIGHHAQYDQGVFLNHDDGQFDQVLHVEEEGGGSGDDDKGFP